MTKKTKLFRIKFAPDPTYGALYWTSASTRPGDGEQA